MCHSCCVAPPGDASFMLPASSAPSSSPPGSLRRPAPHGPDPDPSQDMDRCHSTEQVEREPLQDQPARHRVQPLRGARPRRGPRQRSLRGDRRRDRPRASSPRSSGCRASDLAASLRRRRPQPAGLRPRRPTPRPCPSRSRRATRPGWTPSSGACRSARSSAARPPRPASSGPSARWCSAPTPPCGCTPPAPPSPASSTTTATSATSASPSSWSSASGAATMVLTEPDAGSDVGAGRTKATPNEDGSWNIEGVKRFITSAEHDMTENIMHLVLARPEGVEGAGGPGTKGLSLFLVPKYPLRPRDRRADRRAQRRLRHQRRAQDGHQGLQHLRDDLRRPAGRRRRAGQGLAARRGARRHRARCSTSSRTPG